MPLKTDEAETAMTAVHLEAVEAVGCAVMPGILIRRLPCSITESTYKRVPLKV